MASDSISTDWVYDNSVILCNLIGDFKKAPNFLCKNNDKVEPQLLLSVSDGAMLMRLPIIAKALLQDFSIICSI